MAAKHSDGFPNFLKNSAEWVVGGSLDVNGRADRAIFTFSAPAGTDRDISVQLQDALGNVVEAVQGVEVHVFADAEGLDWATTGGTTGIVDNGDGSILALVAKKVFTARSAAAGVLQIRWTDTGSEVAFLGIKFPSGRVVIHPVALTI